MKIHYDKEVDELYFRFDDTKIAESEEVRPGIVLDFNDKNQVVGIEIRSLAQRGITPDQLREVKFEGSP